MAPPTPSPSLAQIEEIAERAAVKAVHSILVTLGVDTSKPIEAQRDFQLLRDLTRLAADTEYRKDLEYLRTWRKRTESAMMKAILVAVTVVVGGILTASWHNFQALISLPKPPA